MNNKSSVYRVLLRSTALSACALVALVNTAHAQETTAPAPAGSEETAQDVIVVTGSRIARVDLQAASPVSVVSSESIKLSGTGGVEEFLRDIPQAVAAIGSSTNNGNEGAATVDLRNLGEERTLVLVDGKRFVPYDSNGIVDLNMIPSSLIERVEVVTGGASAVYGSDAIAGVVNFILKKDFQGIEGDAQYGLTQRGDGRSANLSLTAGTNFAEDRGNITISGTYSKQQAIYQGDRKFSQTALAAADLSASGSANNAPGFLDLGPDGYQFTPGGGLVNLTTDPDAYEPFNFNPFNLLQTPEEKWTATALLHYDISDNIQFYSRGSYAQSKVSTIIAPTLTGFFPFNINYLDNPNLNAQARSVLAGFDVDDPSTPDVNEAGDGIVSAGIGRRLNELGTRDSIYKNKAWQIVGGFKGDFSDTLHWEVFGQYAKTKRTQDFKNDVAYDRLFQAIQVNAAGTCVDPSGGCVPANIFGPDTLSDAAADYVRLDLHETDKTTQFVTGGFISGDLPFTVPLASKPGAFVVGVEYRKETSKARPDANLIAGNSIGFGSSTPIDAQYDVKEAYAELKVPLINDMAFAQELNLEAGVRYADYKNKVKTLGTGNSYSNWSWKIGGDWKPINDIRFRVMYQRAVRAPNLNEIGQPKTPSTGDATFDPCAGANPVGNPTLTQLCIDTGVPAASIGAVGGPNAGQINNFVGGNPELVPEKSSTWTIGAVLQPQALPGFTATVDFFDIKVKKAILQIPEQSVLDICYGIEQDAAGDFCSLISRGPNGRLVGDTSVGVDVARRNIGLLRSQGIDASAQYRFDVGSFGNLRLAISATRQIKSDLQFASLLPTNHCVGLVGKICLRPDPKWRWSQTTTWNNGPLTVQLRWQYIGSLTNDTVAFGTASASDFVVPRIKKFNFFDLSSTYDATENFTLRAGINNLFDKKPPVVGNDYGGTAENSGNTYPATYDALGRKFFVGATVRF